MSDDWPKSYLLVERHLWGTTEVPFAGSTMVGNSSCDCLADALSPRN